MNDKNHRKGRILIEFWVSLTDYVGHHAGDDIKWEQVLYERDGLNCDRMDVAVRGRGLRIVVFDLFDHVLQALYTLWKNNF